MIKKDCKHCARMRMSFTSISLCEQVEVCILKNITVSPVYVCDGFYPKNPEEFFYTNTVKCSKCGYEWVAVVEGTPEKLECSKCRFMTKNTLLDKLND